METKKTQFKLTRVLYLLWRGSVRVLTIPFRGMPEGGFKSALRLFILTFQHSLPTEFVVNKGETIVQVGTPRPRTMKRFLRAVGPKGKLVVVEAMPENQERLENAIKSEGIKNVLLIKGAASNENRMGELLISPYSGDHKIETKGIVMDNDYKPGNNYETRIPVRFLRLEDELRKHGIEEINFLSVTVNGAEAEVLKGASGLLKLCGPGTRVYAKGHALDENDQPIHLITKEIMTSNGYNTKITRGEPSSTLDSRWLWRAGDLYAWKT